MQPSEQINELALFSGIAGLSHGLHMADERIRAVCHVEIDRYAAAVLMSRMRSGDIPFAPIWDDVRSFDGKSWCGVVDIISGGFPCQDVSAAGARRGLQGEMSGLWIELRRIIGEVLPSFVFVENSPELIRRYGNEFFASMAGLGYDSEWGIVSASMAGFNHIRERSYIISYPNSLGFQHLGRVCERLSTYEKKNTEERGADRVTFIIQNNEMAFSKWRSERQVVTPRPLLVRSNDGIQVVVERIRRCGNAVVPQQAALAWQILTDRACSRVNR